MIIPHEHIVYTIGHSTYTLEDFLAVLQSFDIKILVDIRRFPGSRKFPHFNKDNLEASLKKSGIGYVHMKELDGRRRPRKDSKNTVWSNVSFRGYADYMETDEFVFAVAALQAIARQSRTVYMCSEALWWRCHRSLVSDYLKANGWTVFHIMGLNKGEEHRYTAAANIAGKRLSYTGQKM